MDPKLLDILACPVCKQPLKYHKEQQELVCTFDKLAYQIRDGIPVMLPDDARELSQDEVEAI